MSASSLCDRCLACVRALDELLTEESDNSLQRLDDRHEHHMSLESFELAVQQSCLICNYLSSNWSPCSNIPSFSTTWQPISTDPTSRPIHFGLEGREPVLVNLVAIENDQVVSQHNKHAVASHTSDDSVLEEAKSWLDYCKARHPLCTKRRLTSSHYPSRLVDLLPQGESGGAIWRLIDDTSAIDVEDGYATLSHRWGNAAEGFSPYMLTKDTYEDMRKGVPDTYVTGTCQDAMKVVRKLGLRYIWIDFLCIPQDAGLLNIQLEAAKMDSVYGNSSCNVSALTARQDTIFTSRNPLLYSAASTMVTITTTSDSRKSFAVLLSKIWESSMVDTPLSRRGWILQEQLLPRRTLYFGANQMLWSCLEGSFCELYPLNDWTATWLSEGMYEGDFGTLRRSIGYGNRALSTTSSGNDDDDDLIDDTDYGLARPDDVWSDLLALYGQRQLTFAGDKLLAIAGICQRLSSIWNDHILGGLVLSRLPEGLLWIMDHDAARRDGYGEIRRSPVARAPSWSWAYYDGPVGTYSGPTLSAFTQMKPVARVEEIEKNSTIVNEVELTTAGHLHLLAASLPIYPVSSPPPSHSSSIPVASTSQNHREWFMPLSHFSFNFRSSSTSPLSSPPLLSPESISTTENGLTLYSVGIGDTNDKTPDSKQALDHGQILFDIDAYATLNENLTVVFVMGNAVTLPRSFEAALGNDNDDDDDENGRDRGRGSSRSHPDRIFRFDGLVLRPHPLYPQTLTDPKPSHSHSRSRGQDETTESESRDSRSSENKEHRSRIYERVGMFSIHLRVDMRKNGERGSRGGGVNGGKGVSLINQLYPHLVNDSDNRQRIYLNENAERKDEDEDEDGDLEVDFGVVADFMNVFEIA